MKAYVDTNIYDYVAVRHPVYGLACKEVLRDLAEARLEGYGSILVPIEILGSLAKISYGVAVEAVRTYFSLPIKEAPLDQNVLADAGIIAAQAGVTYDAIHAAAMAAARVSTVITEDVRHWERMSRNWNQLRRMAPLDALEVVRPLAYEKWRR